jgi:TolB-like protein
MVVIGFLILNHSPSFAYEKEIKSLSSSMAENIVKAGKKTIAVVDFVDLQGNVTELGRFIAEEFSIALTIVRKGFKVVDRTHLKTILKEHKLVITGMIDPTTAKKLGQISGVDSLVTGTITPFGDSVRLAVKILDTATGDVIDALSGDIAKTKAIEELLTKGIDIGTQTAVSSAGGPSLPTPKQSVKVQDFIFQLIEAKSGGDTVNCHILITNNDPADRDLALILKTYFYGSVYDKSFIIDNFGNKYGIDEISLGTQSPREGKVLQLLASGVPTNARVFSKISPKAQKIALLEILCRQRNQEFKVQFRNISLTR